MEIFIITFIIFLIIILIMSLGVMLMNKNIKGSCGGLNAISGSNKCSVCNKDIDPNSPLVTQLNCKKYGFAQEVDSTQFYDMFAKTLQTKKQF